MYPILSTIPRNYHTNNDLFFQARENDNPKVSTPSRSANTKAKRSKSAGMSRPGSAKNGAGGKGKEDKSGAAGTGARGLLSSMKKLNPAVLF